MPHSFDSTILTSAALARRACGIRPACPPAARSPATEHVEHPRQRTGVDIDRRPCQSVIAHHRKVREKRVESLAVVRLLELAATMKVMVSEGGGTLLLLCSVHGREDQGANRPPAAVPIDSSL